MSVNVVTLTSSNFDTEIKKDSPIVVDFWAEWCGPCKMVAPVLEKLADDYVGKARVGKVNVDDQGGLATKYGIQSIPTLLVFKAGKVVDQYIGATSRDVIARMIDRHL
jgi:thioredoxin 1